MNVVTLGTDLGKTLCSVASMDVSGKVVLWRRVRRSSLAKLAGKLPACTVAMEACCGAHYAGRLFASRGYEVRTMPPNARGTPLGLILSSANWHDSILLAATLDAAPGVRRGRGRPRKRPSKLHADKAYDHRRCSAECRTRSITPRTARRGVETSQRFGRRRWVVERTFAWHDQFRRLTIRYERRADIHQAFTTLGCVIICMNQIKQFR